MSTTASYWIPAYNRIPPPKDEYYGPGWFICHTDDTGAIAPVVIVPDPGDGSARPLADKILALLHEGK